MFDSRRSPLAQRFEAIGAVEHVVEQHHDVFVLFDERPGLGDVGERVQLDVEIVDVRDVNPQHGDKIGIVVNRDDVES